MFKLLKLFVTGLLATSNQTQATSVSTVTTFSKPEFKSQDTNHHSDSNINTDIFSTYASQSDRKIASINLAYKVNKKDFSNQIETFVEQYKGWQVIADSTQSPDTNKCHYKAVALMNPKSKEVCIATAGTKMTDAWDLYDDASLAMGYLPSKIKPMAKFIDNALKALPGDLNQYTFSATGHSLGAVMTHLTACEIASRGLKVAESVSFDTPGSKHVVQKAIKDNVFTGSHQVNLDQIDTVEFNAKLNLINRGLPHAANQFNVNITKKPYQAETMLIRLIKKFGLGEVLKLEEHKLSKFEKAEFARVEGWQNSKDAPLFAHSKEDFKLIRNSKAEMVTLFEEEKEDGITEILMCDSEKPDYLYTNYMEGSWMGIHDETQPFDLFSI